MQVSVESGQGLERRMTVELPASELDEEVTKRLKQISRTARMDGFRPGKVPLSVIRQRYGKQVRGEVFGEMMQASFGDAVAQQSLRPAGRPRFETGDSQDKETLSYTAIFETLPQIELREMGDLTIKRPVAEVTDEDVAAMLDKLRRQRITWNPVERPAALEDQVRISYRGSVDGEPFAGGEAQDVPLVLGSSSMIEGFDQGLIGAAPGDSRTLALQFPDDYRVAELAGKPVVFEVQVASVAEPLLPAIDDELARMFGITDGGLEKLKEDVRSNMDRELKQRSWAKIKTQAMDALLEANTIALPKVLVDEEVENLRRKTRERVTGSSRSGGLELPRELFEEQARRRVALGLIIAEVVKQNGIQLDAERVRRTVEELASEYEQPQEVIGYYYSHREQLASVESLVLEDQVIDWMLGKVRLEEEPTSFSALTEAEGQ